MLFTTDIKFVKASQRIKSKIASTEALLKAVGSVGMAGYLGEYDNGGQGTIRKRNMDSQITPWKKF